MSDSIETQGKTVDEAVSEALLRMGARRDEVIIKILEHPKSGFMGFIGGRQARVLVSKKQPRRGSSRGGARRDRDQAAHDLSGDRNAAGRGSRQRGGRRPADANRDDARGDSRDSGADRGRGRRPARDEGGEAKTQARDNNRQDGGRRENQDSSGRSRRRSRGGRGRGGRGRTQQDGQARNQDGQDQGQRDQGQRDQGQRDQGQRDQGQRDQGQRVQGQRDRGQRDQNRQDQGSTPARAQRAAGARPDGRGRSRRDDRRDEQRTAEPEQRPPSRSDRNRDDQPQPQPQPEIKDEGLTMATEAPTAPPTEPVEVIDALSVIPSADKGNDRARPRAWGGLGARLPRKTPDGPLKTVDELSPAAIGAVPPVRKPKPASTKPRTAHVDLRKEASSSAPNNTPRRGEEVLASEIAATRYAKPLTGVTTDGQADALNDLASGMLARAGFPCECSTMAGEYHNVKVATDEDSAGMLIGRHGQTVDAVEHLVERMASNAAGDRVRMNLDINDYRIRREETLRERAQTAIDDVRQTGEPYHFEPMSARERRVVHMATADAEGLTTYTVMGSNGKHVVLAVDDDQGDGQDDSRSDGSVDTYHDNAAGPDHD